MLSGYDFAQMIVSGGNCIYNDKEKIDELNVFPVPDGDTGKNMSLTMSGAIDAAIKMDKDIDLVSASEKIASATLRSARGNSGVILSQLFRGISKYIKQNPNMTELDIAYAFKTGADAAYEAVMKPTEGTILTVARESAESGVNAVGKSKDINDILDTITKSAEQSLQNTPNLLKKLKDAGVVDAGGMGWLRILEGMKYYVDNNKVVEIKDGIKLGGTVQNELISTEDIEFEYCTEFVVRKVFPACDVAMFRETIEPTGDSMLVIEDSEIVKVHIHTNDPGFILTNAIKMGQVMDIKIDNMKIQNEIISTQAKPVEKKEYAIVSVANGEGICALMQELGVDYVLSGGQTMNPSAGDIAKAVQSVNAKTVYVLPNNKNILLAAKQAKDIHGDCHVEVIGTKTIPQGINALLEFSPEQTVKKNARAMQTAANNVKTALITYAVRDSKIGAISIKEGDIIGMEEDKIVETGTNPDVVLENIVKGLVNKKCKTITVFFGDGIEHTEKIQDAFEKMFPQVDISFVNGKQPVYYYIVSAE